MRPGITTSALIRERTANRLYQDSIPKTLSSPSSSGVCEPVSVIRGIREPGSHVTQGLIRQFVWRSHHVGVLSGACLQYFFVGSYETLRARHFGRLYDPVHPTEALQNVQHRSTRLVSGFKNRCNNLLRNGCAKPITIPAIVFCFLIPT